jgi:branched-chain amino acid transport system permease protein
LHIGGEAFEEPMSLFLEQLLNGLGLGITLFIIAGGLTLVFGIMNLLNLAHGSLYMIGAYFCASLLATLKSFPLAVLGAIVLTALVGLLIERLVIRHFYRRDHLDQVLATFGLLVFFNELVRVVWGRSRFSSAFRRAWPATCRSWRGSAIRCIGCSCS